MSSRFIMPKQVFYGEGALGQASSQLSSMGDKALIVTDPTMVKLNNVKLVTDILDKTETPYHIFDEVTGEPTDLIVRAAVKAYEEAGCDFLIAVGGGSPIDTMKAVAAVVSGKEDIDSYLGREITVPTPPMAAIPTTSGTGSEATQFTIITDTAKNIKMLLLKGAPCLCRHRY